MLRRDEAGFSLMEVNLSIFLVAAGLLVLFSLYPLGLQESEKAMSDSQEAMFADFVLNTIKGTSMSISNWTEWTVMEITKHLGEDGISFSSSRYDPPKKLDSFPFVTGTEPMKPLKYQLLVEDYPSGSNGERKRVTLTVKGGKYGSLDEDAKCYVTDVYFCGM